MAATDALLVRTTQQQTGDGAEALVAEHLAAMGWRILGRQLRLGRVEVDLLAVDPAPPAELVVVEVRMRGRRDFGLPEETLDHAKRLALRRAVGALRVVDALPDGTPLPPLMLRVDLVAVEPRVGSGAPPAIRHHRAITV